VSCAGDADPGQVINDNDVADLTTIDASDFRKTVRFDLFDEDTGRMDDDHLEVGLCRVIL
jgi:hypothetical protein